jgi:hypothetical protein
VVTRIRFTTVPFSPTVFSKPSHIIKTYIQTISSLDNFDPQALALNDLETTLSSLKQQLLTTKAAKLLLPAKETFFSRIVLVRLVYLLNLVLRPNRLIGGMNRKYQLLGNSTLCLCLFIADPAQS